MNQEKIKALDAIIARDYHNIAGLVVLKGGKTAYEKYYNNCTAHSQIHVYSVSKSILSLLVGIALDKGYIKSVNQKVLDFFPHYLPQQAETTIQNITLENLLTMTAPYKYRFAPYTYLKYFASDDWVKFTLDLLGGKGQIGDFRYTPLVGPDILSGILVNATGQSVLDFASDYLFSPLGIAVGRSLVFRTAKEQSAFNKATNISGWAADQAGVNAGGWGLTLSAADMAKVGQLCLDKGLWNGTRIVSAEWVEESTKEHSRWGERNLPYGYLWWIVNKADRACAAMGDGGNVIYFNAKEKLVVAIACLFAQNAKDRIALIQKYIEPMFVDSI